jgi:hypothetical protein
MSLSLALRPERRYDLIGFRAVVMSHDGPWHAARIRGRSRKPGDFTYA